jgi:acyl-coenzyme A synthetase/AMP-(fatty) acid ligase/thioesterase domain-containing protein/acyl carrier protein
MNEISPNSEWVPAGGDTSSATLSTSFRRQAASTPDIVAIATDDRACTYRALDALSDRIAAMLLAQQSWPDLPVVVLVEDAVLHIASMLAAAKANRIFIPLDCNAPEPWLLGIVQDSGAAHIVADSPARATADRVSGEHATVLDVEFSVSPEIAPTVDVGASPDSPACIMYTSGSTGKPKGVILTNRGVLFRSTRGVGRAEIRPGNRIAHLRAGGFVPGRTNVFATLLSGATILPFEIGKRGLHSFASWLNAEGPEGFTITSSLFRTFLASLPDDLRFPRLRFVSCVSEPLYGVDVARAANHLTGDWTIEFSYGTTEVGRVAGNIMGPQTRLESGVLPVGKIQPGYEVWLENEDGAVTRSGHSGEVIIKTRYLAGGYWNEPELSAATFPVDPSDDSRVYRTGDLGRWREDGLLQHVGRKDRRFKLRGHTVELYEIECALLRLRGVTEATVVFLSDGPDEASIVGYIVGPEASAARVVREQLAKELPAHMVPAHIVVVKALPLTVSGKIDRAGLPPPVPDKALAPSSRLPRTETERALSLIWQGVLNTTAIGIDDHFDDLGGTSLQAFQIFAEIERALGYDLPPTAVFEAPTIARLAALLEGRISNRETSKLITFCDRGSKPPLFLIHAGFGDLAYARELARHLKDSRPVLGLRPPKLDGTERLTRTLEGIAADYISEIRTVQPAGPFFLAGHSFGGWIAFEMARQLWSLGETIGFVGLIDTYAKSARNPPAPRVVRHVKAMRRKSIRELVEYVGVRSEKNLAYVFAAVRLALRERLPTRIGRTIINSPSYDVRPDLYRRIYRRALRRYVPQPLAVPLVLFSASGLSEMHRTHWSLLAKSSLSVIETAAGHSSIVWPPYSRETAAALDRCMEGTG